ncbi:MAG: tRNA (adenosine(37)-N6)-threonylcarbamoyltransferase complex transferase subunit TsaD [Thermoflexales bacterium]|nr:tRNA (adenosine(37)-N6)-threonylcarbamoyltransferase complex transferase subunit TsaD [Thermoflexales bacterium]MCS7324078.1 tRNA (adenosine(37)-N6)-threonylcarbamoyltransferase complex transferase subunit TsaD [Thermoflexales bacterium]MCX7939397.1 tRNA (adenosine(37)-N6)-threonylcarbamoyltransferase complex transferase subunit TsaD [Thermoflexales bacterium]MDW8054127.1 tRNA (adenosine(37)-N6)-threonylcarbamoyltransferase complex transferase subunit TsaD [Anaerolineae bacterium]MDW8293542.
MRILAIETSCDETAAAVVDDGHVVRSNVVASQAELHRQYGGVFPELASRAHVEAIAPVVQKAMDDARATWDSLSAIAVTRGPGLPGSLVVGVNMAKGISLATGLPLIGINHLEGHIYAHWLSLNGRPANDNPMVYQLLHSEGDLSPFPLVALIVSGGHTELVLMHAHGHYELLGHTVDDAAGEAFDKVARLLGLGYPGGPAIQRAAQGGNPHRFKFSRPRISLNARTVRTAQEEFLFSFSGIKTQVLRLVQAFGMSKDGKLSPQTPVSDIAASFQNAVTDWLVEKTARAAERYGARLVLVGGGVSANQMLRQKMRAQFGSMVAFPPLWLCTDNAAMIGAAAYYALRRGLHHDLTLDVAPDLKLPES